MAVKEQIIKITAEVGDVKRQLEDVNRAFQNQEKQLENVNRKLQDSGTNFGFLQKGLLSVDAALNIFSRGLSTVQNVANTLFTTLDQGGNLINLQRGFESLKESTGATEISLKQLQTATYGLVESTELLTQANTAMTLGLPGDQLDEIYEKVIRLARAQGVDALRGIESYTVGVARQSKLQLDNLGILVNTEAAYEKFARTINKTAATLSDQEKQAAFAAAALEALNEKAAQVADVQLNAADAGTRLKVAYQEQVNELGVALASNDALRDALLALTNVVENFDTSAVVVGITEIIKASEGAIETLNDLAIGLAATTNPIGYMAEATRDMQKSMIENAQTIEEKNQLLGVFSENIQEASRKLDEAKKRFGENSEEAERAAGVLQGYWHAFDDLQRAIDKAENPQQRFNKSVAETDEAARKAAEEIAKLRREFEQLGGQTEIKGLQRSLEEAIEGVDRASFDIIKAQIEQQFREVRTAELTAKFGKAVDDAQIAEQVKKEWEIAGQAYDERMEASAERFGANVTREQEQAARQLQRKQEETYRKLADFYGDVITGVIEGDIEEVLTDMLTRAAIEFGAEMLAQMTIAAAASAGIRAGGNGIGGFLGNLFNIGGGAPGAPGVPVPVSGTPVGGAPLGGAGAFSSLGQIGAAMAALYAIDSGVKGALGDKSNSFGGLAVRGLATGFLSPGVALDLGDKLFGGSLNKDQARVGGVVDSLIEAGVFGEKGTFSLFGGGEGRIRASADSALAPGAEQFAGFGNLFSILTEGEVDEKLAGLFANAISEADSFNAAVLTTAGLLEDMGIDAETAGKTIIDAYYEGKISLDEMNASLNTLSTISQDDLPSLTDGIHLFADSLDDPKSAVKALGLLFQEFAQAGITDTEEMVRIITELLGPEVGQAFANITASGIDTFEEVKNATVPQIQLILNEVNNMNSAWQDFGAESARATEDAVRGMERFSEETKRARREVQGLRGDINSLPSGGAVTSNFGV